MRDVKLPCLIDQTVCGRKPGKPVCTKCGMDDQVVYPRPTDLELAQYVARATYWKRRSAVLDREIKKTKSAAALKVAEAAFELPQETKGHGAFLRLSYPSVNLAKIVGAGPISRTDVTKKIWEYIKKNKLQDPLNRRMINCDGLLHSVCQKKQISLFELTKVINEHLSLQPVNLDKTHLAKKSIWKRLFGG